MRRWSLAAGLAGAALLVAGCSDPAGPPTSIEQLPRPLSAAEQSVLSASNEFAFDLLRDVHARESESPNVVLSPLSASMALGMAMNGADGATYDEMRAALGFGSLAREDVNAAYRNLMDLLLGLDPSVEITVANSTWARDGFPFLPSFYDVVAQFFDAEAHVLDFASDQAPAVINGWVEEQTHGRIDTIIEQIRPSAVMFLLNAVYFKGSWRTRFDVRDTRDAEFHLDDGGSVQVPMMHASNLEVRMAYDRDAQIAELPYGAGAFTMVLVQPPPASTLADLVAGLDAATWDRWMGALGTLIDADLAMPRFEIEYDRVLDETLQAIGMQQAFDGYRADFSRMSAVDGLYIEEVRQKTFLRVDEEGTEAAAATSVEVGLVSAPPAMRLDRPFLLAIRERHSGTILFIGAIGDPR
jgi:serpin B